MASDRVPSNLESQSLRFKGKKKFTVNFFFYDQGLKLFFGPFYQQPLTVNPIKTLFSSLFIGAKNNKNRS